MSPRTGRPTDNPKANRESFRFSKEDIRKLEFCVEETGLTKTEIIRRGIDMVYEDLLKEKE